MKKRIPNNIKLVICWYGHKICNISEVSSLHSPDLLYHCLLSLISQPSRGDGLEMGCGSLSHPPSQQYSLPQPSGAGHACRSCRKCGWKKWGILDFSLRESPSQLRCPPGVKLLGPLFSRMEEISPFSRRGWHIHMAMCYSQFWVHFDQLWVTELDGRLWASIHPPLWETTEYVPIWTIFTLIKTSHLDLRGERIHCSCWRTAWFIR